MRHSRWAWERAARSVGVVEADLCRPDLVRWLWYAFWGPLPDRYAGWVLYDATCSTWVLRHFARILTVAALPVTALILFLPGPTSIRVDTAVVCGILAVLLTGVWTNEGTDYRVERAGWPIGIASRLRERRSEFARWR